MSSDDDDDAQQPGKEARVRLELFASKLKVGALFHAVNMSTCLKNDLTRTTTRLLLF